MKVPLSQCSFDAEVQEAVVRALRSGQYILGKECDAFEAELAAYTGTRHCVLGSSWTMCVFLLHQLQGLGPGDEVIVPSHTAFPTIEPLLQRGARPVFVDVDDGYTLDLAQIQAAISPRTVGIIPVHLYGHPVDMDRLQLIAAKYHLWVLEDCAQAQGAKYKNRRVGSMADFGAFSFFPSKNLTVLGDGGCIATNDSQIAERLRMLRNHGRKTKYEHEFAGYNARFNEINAAVGRVMLSRLDQANEHRRKIAACYRQQLKGLVRLPPEMEWAEPVYHLFVIRCERRDELRQFLKQRDIETGIHYPIPNHRQQAVSQLFPVIPALSHTDALVNEILSLPMYGEMGLEAAHFVCDSIEEFYCGSREAPRLERAYPKACVESK